jgi:excisionase family DNA binding protein
VENTASGRVDSLLTVPEVATALRLDETTVSKMCRNGELGAFRVGVGRGRWRIPAARVEALKTGQLVPAEAA